MPKTNDEDMIDNIEVEDENQPKNSETAKFTCPNCGTISQDDVIFVCNHCDSDELIFKEGLYICPSCLKPGENFECMLCGSKEVKITIKGEKSKKKKSKTKRK